MNPNVEALAEYLWGCHSAEHMRSDICMDSSVEYEEGRPLFERWQAISYTLAEHMSSGHCMESNEETLGEHIWRGH